MAKLIADNPELLIYLDGKLHITILGGIKLPYVRSLSERCPNVFDFG
jgi:hypothetical protein